MEMRQVVPKQTLVGYVCDICGQSCNASQDGRYEAHEFALLYARWGYHSRKDMQSHECHMCENCYDRVWEFVETLGGKVRVIEDGSKEGADYVIVGQLPGSVD